MLKSLLHSLLGSVTLICFMHSSLSGDVSESVPLPEDYFENLREILDLAGTRAPALVQVGLEREIADQELRIARARYYPTLGVSGNFGYRFEDRGDGGEDFESVSVNASLGLSRPLYHWGSIKAQVNIGEINFENSLIQTRQSFQDVIVRLREDYLRLVLSEMRLRNARLRRNILEQEIAQKAADFEAGVMSDEAYLNFQIDLENSLLEIDDLEMRKDRLVAEFSRIAGLDREIPIPARVDALDIEALDRLFGNQFAGSSWIDQTDEVRLSQNEMEKESRNRIIVNSRQTPNLSFSANISQRPVNTANENDVNTISYFAGISVGWNIFDGFATQASKRISFLRSRKLEFEHRNILSTRQLDETELRERIQIQLRKHKLLESQLDLFSRVYQRAKRDHEMGQTSANDLRESQLQFYNLELRVHESRVELLMMLTRYLVLTGRDRGLQYLKFDTQTASYR
ncbi:MAG: TolC family protein [Puniceicoccaceae bacterium]